MFVVHPFPSRSQSLRGFFFCVNLGMTYFETQESKYIPMKMTQTL